MRSTKKVVYSDYALGGNVVALGGNLWNEKLPRALAEKGDFSELNAAAKVFFDEILPELENFVEQKLEKRGQKVRCCFAGVGSACPIHEVRRRS